MAKFTAAERSGLIFLLVIIALVTIAVWLSRNNIQIHPVTIARQSPDSITVTTDTVSAPRTSARKNNPAPRSHLNEPLPAQHSR